MHKICNLFLAKSNFEGLIIVIVLILMDGISINNWLISRILLLTRSLTCRLSSPLFEIVATHRLRVPSLVDYRRHSSRSWPPIAYAFLHLSTIVATLRDRGHPSLTRSFTCRLSSPLFEIVATHRLRVPSLVDYRRHSSRSFSPPQDLPLLGFLNTKSSLESTDSIFLNKIEQKCNMFTHFDNCTVQQFAKSYYLYSELKK